MARHHVIGALALAAAPAVLAQDQQPPRFQSGVEVVTVDVTVVDGDGRSILGLGPGDFAVDVDGQRRRVVSAQWIALTPEPAVALPGASDGEGKEILGRNSDSIGQLGAQKRARLAVGRFRPELASVSLA